MTPETTPERVEFKYVQLPLRTRLQGMRRGLKLVWRWYRAGLPWRVAVAHAWFSIWYDYEIRRKENQ